MGGPLHGYTGRGLDAQGLCQRLLPLAPESAVSGVRCVVVASHSPDTLLAGWLQAQMGRALLCKASSRLGGGPGDARDTGRLNRVLRWTPRGLRYEAAPGMQSRFRGGATQLGWGEASWSGRGECSIVCPGLERASEVEEEARPLHPELGEQRGALAVRAKLPLCGSARGGCLW